MANSADPYQANCLDLHCLQRQGISGFSRTRVKMSRFLISTRNKKGKRKVQGMPQSQAAAHPRHKEEEETDKTKHAQIKQRYEKH